MLSSTAPNFSTSAPDLVLDVGVQGMINVIDACRGHGIGTLVLASSSEVYQTPPHDPDRRSVPLIVPDPLNPRYSYGAGKMISEVMAINYGRKFFERVLIFRPHNVYGPDMGFEHVIPQFALRLNKRSQRIRQGGCRFEIQGTGAETRSFCHIDDLVAGVMVMRDKGEHLGIYHVGTMEEMTIADLAQRIAASCRPRHRAGRRSAGARAAPPRRCPDISQAAKLGYKPHVPLDRGLQPTLDWYWANNEPRSRSTDGRLDRVERDRPCVPAKSRAPPAPARSVPVECCQICGTRSSRRAVARLHAAGQPDGADRRGAAPAAVVPDQPSALSQMRTGAARSGGRSRSSSFRRNIPTPAAPPSCLRDNFADLVCGSPRRCWASARTIWSSISVPTTAR